MIYKINITRTAIKELSSIDRSKAIDIKDKIMTLKENPHPAGSKKLVGRDGWRLRYGDYTVIYEIEENEKSILILHIGHRKDIYK